MIPREFIEYLMDSIAPLGPVSPRRMFGCTALFHTGRMFALVDDDAIFIKVDDISRPLFEAEGLRPLTYQTSRGGEPRTVALSYYAIPDAAPADPDEMLRWARLGMAAAARAPVKPVRRKGASQRR